MLLRACFVGGSLPANSGWRVANSPSALLKNSLTLSLGDVPCQCVAVSAKDVRAAESVRVLCVHCLVGDHCALGFQFPGLATSQLFLQLFCLLRGDTLNAPLAFLVLLGRGLQEQNSPG